MSVFHTLKRSNFGAWHEGWMQCPCSLHVDMNGMNLFLPLTSLSSTARMLCVLAGLLAGPPSATAATAKGGDPSGAAVGTAEGYIEQWQDEAVRQMQKYGIPASITLAQGILESGNGVSELAQRSNNHFGIKCHASWTGKRTYHDDDEKGECFRVYDDPIDSYEDHSQFLLRDRYARLFELEPTDYEGWAKGLKACGYATDPAYADRLITLIERHDLQLLDDPNWVAEAGDRGEGASGEGNGQDEESGVAEAEADRAAAHEWEVRKARKGGGSLDLASTHRIRTTEHGVQYVYVEPGDTPEALARALNLMPWQVRKYNEVRKDHAFEAGDRLYLQPKKGHAAHGWHTVRAGQTLWDISQLHGIKTTALARKNRLDPSEPVKPGTKLSMQWPLNKEGKLPWYAKAFGAT